MSRVLAPVTARPRIAAMYAAGAMATATLLWLSVRGSVEFEWTEVVGFATGALCVWLTVEERVSQWPIGNASDGFYVVVFARAGLYADTVLQVVYIVLGFIGWYWWLRGGPRGGRLAVRRSSAVDIVTCALGIVVLTAVLDTLLGRFTDSTVPFWDSMTTALSLVATYMLTRKLIESWFVWMTTDVMYVGLYIYKSLYLTAVLYAVFLMMCCAGLVQWWRSLATTRRAAIPDVAAATA